MLVGIRPITISPYDQAVRSRCSIAVIAACWLTSTWEPAPEPPRPKTATMLATAATSPPMVSAT